MVMTGGEGEDARGAFVDRNVFYEIEQDRWRWRKDRSWDGGESWIEGIGYIEATRRSPATIGRIAATPHFTFHSNFWLNLHHFLYRLAGVSERTPVGEDQLELVEKLPPTERARLDEAVDYYAEHLVGESLLRGDVHFSFKRWAIGKDELDTLSSMSFEPRWLDLLNALRPVYERHFWPLHDARNRELALGELQTIETIEANAVRRIAKLAESPWPAASRSRRPQLLRELGRRLHDDAPGGARPDLVGRHDGRDLARARLPRAVARADRTRRRAGRRAPGRARGGAWDRHALAALARRPSSTSPGASCKTSWPSGASSRSS